MKRLAAFYAAMFAAFFIFFATQLAAQDRPPVETAIEAPALTEAEFKAPPAPVRAAVVPVPDAGGGSDWTSIADQVFNAAALGLIGWIIRLIGPALLRASDWIGQRAAAEDLLRDEKMAGLSKMVGAFALDLALGRLGYTRADLKDVRIRNAALSMAAEFVREQWPEIWKWVDKDKNGQIDWFEATAANDLPPVDHAKAALAGGAPAA